MNKYVERAIEHYQDNIGRLNRNTADCVDMLTEDKSTDRLEQYLRDHHIYVDSDHCPLCCHYFCRRCPVGMMGHTHCDSTPWHDLARLYYCDYLADIRSRRSAVCYVNKLRKAFEAELEFLKEVDE